MILLICGASHTGKTLLAQRLLEQHRYPYLSIDHLKMGLIRSGQTALTPQDDDALTGYLWPIVREMMQTALENEQNLIVEGCYIPFDFQKDFSEEALRSIRCVCLVFSAEYIKANYVDILNHGNAIEQRLGEDCDLAALLADNKRCLDACTKHDLPMVYIDKRYDLDAIARAAFPHPL